MTNTAIFLLSLVESINASAPSTLLPEIANDLETNVIQAYWTAISFCYSSIVLIPLLPGISEIFGRKIVLLTCLFVLALGTIICGSASNIASLVAGRTLQGLGCGGVESMIEAIDTDFQLKQRPLVRYFLRNVPQLLGLMLGPFLGGFFCDLTTWRCLFWTSLVVIGASTILVVFSLETSYKPPGKSFADLQDVDFTGSLGFVSSTLPVLIAISWGGIIYAWVSWRTLVPLCVGICGLLAWVVYERDRPIVPMLMPISFADRTALSSLADMFLVGLVQFSLLYSLPLYFQLCENFSILVTGAAILAFVASTLPVACIAALAIQKTGHYRLATWLGWTFLASGCGCLALLSPASAIPTWLVISTVSGAGLGVLLASLPIAIQNVAAGVNDEVTPNVARFLHSLGRSCGIVLSTVIFHNVIKDQLLKSQTPVLREQAHSLTKYSLFLRQIMNSHDLGGELLPACSYALRSVWYAVLAAALLGTAVSFFMQQRHTAVRVTEPEKALHVSKVEDEESQTFDEITVSTMPSSRTSVILPPMQGQIWSPPSEELRSPVSPLTPTSVVRARELQAAPSGLDRHEIMSGSTLNECIDVQLTFEDEDGGRVDSQGVKMI
ncbi:MFS general substrate transporter [Polychaeton citri CBS 116435]|uniref:MFS general substrate transporter n=1 Tax=Polychaeton citri CBS 116435 TaxID=1314669 RepID=A0A9P4PYG2_9PEZI|nr:MFS general substrate transporter [Polychaeton citri CBS 116435]